MALPLGDAGDGEALRKAASDWFARMHGPEAERSRLEFERWRANDARNRAAYARLEGNWALASGLRNTPIGRARQLQRKRSWGLGTGQPRLVWAGAAFCAVLVVGGVAIKVRAPGGAVSAPRLASGIGQIRTFRLQDGSNVTLDTDSVVALAFTDTSRVIRLVRGRARFEVAHDRAHPFIVEADGRTVTATGTLFDVSLMRGAVRVNLLRGAVDVRSGTAVLPTPGPVEHLIPGQSLATVKGQTAPAIAAVPKGADRWVSGMLSFDGTALSEVLDETNRYSRTKIRIGAPELAALKVTGAFRPVPASELAASLAAAFSLRVEHRADGSDTLIRP